MFNRIWNHTSRNNWGIFLNDSKQTKSRRTRTSMIFANNTIVIFQIILRYFLLIILVSNVCDWRKRQRKITETPIALKNQSSKDFRSFQTDTWLRLLVVKFSNNKTKLTQTVQGRREISLKNQRASPDLKFHLNFSRFLPTFFHTRGDPTKLTACGCLFTKCPYSIKFILAYARRTRHRNSFPVSRLILGSTSIVTHYSR